jgi:hypothetical protein
VIGDVSLTGSRGHGEERNASIGQRHYAQTTDPSTYRTPPRGMP